MNKKGIDISEEEGINFSTYKTKVRNIRSYISKEYFRLTGENYVFVKTNWKGKHSAKRARISYECKKRKNALLKNNI